MACTRCVDRYDMTGFRFLFFWLLPLLLCMGLPATSLSQSPALQGEVTFGQDGDTLVGAFTIHIPDGYHAYAHDAGDDGLPTTLECTPQAVVHYPKGHLSLERAGDPPTGTTYTGEITLFAAFDGTQAGATYAAKLEMLLCSSQRCLPTSLAFEGELPKDAPPVMEMPWLTRWQEQTRPALTALAPRYDAHWLEISGIWHAIFWGFLAGMVLNIMPCVLPVLSLKLTALLAGNGSVQAMRSYCLFFAAGIMTFFTILALALGLGELLWGQFFQSQALVACLLFAVVILSLSLFGLFTLPVLDLKAASSQRHGCLHAYLTGMLATLLATPCSGPFLGGVLAWVVGQPLPLMLLTFWGVGLGMAFPYFLSAACPQATRLLPRPGPWLEIVEKALAFFLLGTGLYLLSILPHELHLRMLAALLCASFACWLYGRFCGLGAGKLRRRLGFAACSAVVVVCLVVGQKVTVEADIWERYSPETFAASVGKEPLLLEFTADWCPNCKFLEATVLTPANLANWRKRYGLRLIQVDLTAKNAPGLPLLRSLGSQSIPLAAVFPAGARASEPTVLRDVYGRERLERALKETLGEK